MVAASHHRRRGCLGNTHLTVAKQKRHAEKQGAPVHMAAGAVMESGLHKCV